MSVVLWSDLFCEERDRAGKVTVKSVTKVVLFLYLMTRRFDYAYNITQSFQNAREKGKWTEGKGLADLKESSKVSSALNAMARRNLLLTMKEVKSRYSTFSGIPKSEKVRGRERRYFAINPDVLCSPAIITLSPARRVEILGHLNSMKVHQVEFARAQPGEGGKPVPSKISPPEQIPWDSKSDTELVMWYTWYYNDISDIPWLKYHIKPILSYDKYLAPIRLMENYDANPLKIIEFIDKIPKKDYTTILVSAKGFADEISRMYQQIQMSIPSIDCNHSVPGAFQRISDEMKKKNWVFTDMKRSEKARTETFTEFNLSRGEYDAFQYVIPTDMMELSRLIDAIISYLTERERAPPEKPDMETSSENTHLLSKKTKSGSSTRNTPDEWKRDGSPIFPLHEEFHDDTVNPSAEGATDDRGEND